MTRREFLGAVPLAWLAWPRVGMPQSAPAWRERLLVGGHQFELTLDLGTRANAVVIDAGQDGPPLTEEELTRARRLARQMLLDWAATGRPGRRLC